MNTRATFEAVTRPFAARKTAILGDAIFTVDGLCPAEECAALVRLADEIGWEAAPITIGRGQFALAPDYRNNTRVIVDDAARAAGLWRRLAPFVPERRGTLWRAVGLNERFRLYRYAPGQFFQWHRDGAFARDADERSFLTVMIYLSDDIAGGTTDFDAAEGEFQVAPRTGTALVFDHGIRHQGAAVERGVKLVLRTDVMYRREG